MTSRGTVVHESAIVARDAQLGDDVYVGPLCVVEAGVSLGSGTRLLASVVVHTGTTLGANNVVHPFAVLGGAPQDRSYAGEATSLVIGANNVFREHVTVNRGTAKDRGRTSVGDGGLFLAGSHIAHDCVVGDGVTMANATLLGGHVTLGDHVTTGGHVAVQPRVRVGDVAYLAGNAMVETDVPPFVIAAGDRARVRALNLVGLRRRAVSEASIAALERAFRALYRSGEPRAAALHKLREERDLDPSVRAMLAFFR